MRLLANFIILLINAYQKTISPDHGFLKSKYPYGFCRHYPTCSQYTKQAVGRFGAFKGLILGFIRILKCNPWVEPSVDQIPN